MAVGRRRRGADRAGLRGVRQVEARRTRFDPDIGDVSHGPGRCAASPATSFRGGPVCRSGCRGDRRAFDPAVGHVPRCCGFNRQDRRNGHARSTRHPSTHRDIRLDPGPGDYGDEAARPDLGASQGPRDRLAARELAPSGTLPSMPEAIHLAGTDRAVGHGAPGSATRAHTPAPRRHGMPRYPATTNGGPGAEGRPSSDRCAHRRERGDRRTPR
jgi:hypothetical protein